MMTDELFPTVRDKIRSRGHWDVAVHPDVPLEVALPLARLHTTLEQCVVRMRGWPVPFIDYRRELRRGNSWIGQDVDASTVDHSEAWRFFTSGQFAQLRSISADWRRDGDETPVPPWASHAIEVWEILFYLTELLEFASRLALASSAQGFAIDVSLVGMSDRALVAGTRHRELDGRYVFHENAIRVAKKVTVAELTAESRRLAIDMSSEVFDRFGFHASPGALEDYQLELLSYR